jgi:hypothetical protein
MHAMVYMQGGFYYHGLDHDCSVRHFPYLVRYVKRSTTHSSGYDIFRLLDVSRETTQDVFLVHEGREFFWIHRLAYGEVDSGNGCIIWRPLLYKLVYLFLLQFISCCNLLKISSGFSSLDGGNHPIIENIRNVK